MSIQTLREEFKDIPGAHELTMSYEDGGKIEVFTIGGKQAAMSTRDQIKAALMEAVKLA